MSNIIFIDFNKDETPQYAIPNDSEHIASLIKDFQYDVNKADEVLDKYQRLINENALTRVKVKKD